MQQIKYPLNDIEIPRQWYNIIPDLPKGILPPLHPATGKPAGPDDLAPLFPMALIEQEVSQDRWIDIPEEVLDILVKWRPSPLIRATSLEKALGTPAKIYFKYEGVSPAGSHKPNTSIPQAYFNMKEGVKRIATETGAGQWGSALSLACNYFGIEAKVYMVKISYEQKPYRKILMETWGGSVTPSPSKETEAGRKILAENPDSNGSLGIAISEAVEDAAGREDTKYALGSVLNHVLLHQTIIGLETKKQFALAEDKPDVVIGCCGGGSNFFGIAAPYVLDKINGEQIDILGCEPAACPTMTRGHFHYDFGDSIGMTPLLPMHTLGHTFMPPSIHAGGLRYHGMAPLVSEILREGLMRAEAFDQVDCFKAALLFARCEGIVPAPESSHAIRGAINEALKAKEEGKEKSILFLLSGHGHFDMSAYDAYLSNNLVEFDLPESEIERAWNAIKDLPEAAEF
ncbi:MAG: TrpB-like pyridoxal phosphate-dependent enzyme [Deltaproteobacteria bacterium]|nr:MAG: TrpB-like pyridoxal phosphate-dependent enzyme [Deltaproteobacteria bacterium]